LPGEVAHVFFGEDHTIDMGVRNRALGTLNFNTAQR
jgi:hypothetical protein